MKFERFYNLFKPVFIEDYHAFCKERRGHALVYYKTDPFIFSFRAKDYTHTNNWEILEIARVLNRLGFWVDIIDRDADPGKVKLKNHYDIFIGIGAGNSGKHFSIIASRFKKAKKIFYAAGPEPEKSNQLIYKRYKYFEKRHPEAKVTMRRLIDRVDIVESMRNTDSIFCMGNKSFTFKTYEKFGKPSYQMFPSTEPSLCANENQLANRDQKKFLYFGGNGNIVKGLDLLIETFAKLPDYELYVCAPHEPDFEKVYEGTLRESKNIIWEGFIRVGGEKFRELTSKCGYVVLPSCSEGLATSVVTCMRRGLIPIVTFETGIDVEDFGYILEDLTIENLKEKMVYFATLPRQEFIERSTKTYLNSFKYTQKSFSEHFEKALLDILIKNCKTGLI